MRTPLKPVLAVCLAWSALASAQTVYQWTDKNGEVHYTDDKGSIPKGAKVRTTGGAELAEISGDGVNVAPAQAQPAPGATAAPAPATRAPSDAEQYWRGEYRRVRENIRRLEDEIAVETKQVEDPNANGMPLNHMQCGLAPTGFVGGVPVTGQMGCYYLPNPEYQRTKDRLETNKRALKRAKDELQDLDRRAANDAIPLEWRR